MSNNNYSVPTPTDASIILTYRCPMKCKMCNIWFNPTNKSEEIKASDLRTLPKLKFINLTGVQGKRRFLPPYFVGLQQIN